MLKVLVGRDRKQVGQFAGEVVNKAVVKNKHLKLGLATGSSVLELYEVLIMYHQQYSTNWEEVVTFNLDEYVGPQPDDPHSYHAFMFKNLFNYLNIKAANIHFPEVKANQDEPGTYDQIIAKQGGIDLQILGLGQNGHIGFNEPASRPDSVTRVVSLTESTRQANSIFFQGDITQVYHLAVTMGLHTIMQARQIVLLVSGDQKQEIIKRFFATQKTGFNPACPVSILWHHPDVLLVLDEAAAALVKPELEEFLLRAPA